MGIEIDIIIALIIGFVFGIFFGGIMLGSFITKDWDMEDIDSYLQEELAKEQLRKQKKDKVKFVGSRKKRKIKVKGC